MSDAGVGQAIMTARLMRELDEGECRRRNALTTRDVPGFRLTSGDVGTVVETFGNGEAFLVEFSKGKKRQPDSCDWMGVLYPAEIEVGDSVSREV